MANGKRTLLAASTVTEGGNSISLNLNDSWTGRKLLEALDIPPARFSPELMDARFQQKQLMEREQKKSEYATNIRSLAALDFNDNKLLTATLGAGKVRQMFDERRQRTTGIDKSYPLQPISSNTRKSPLAATKTTSLRRSSNGVGLSNSTSSLQKPNNLRSADSVNKTRNANEEFALYSSNISTADFLDNEVFPDETLTDEEDSPANRIQASRNNNMVGLKTLPVKLPVVVKQLSNLSLNLQEPSKQKQLKTRLPATKPQRAASKPAARKLVPLKAPPSQAVEPQKSLVTPQCSEEIRSNRSASPSEKSFNGSSTKSSARTMLTARSGMESSPKQRSARSQLGDSGTPKGPASPGSENMSQCKTCGRNFNVDRLEKHAAICEKTAAKKRKIFDATSHRIMGTEAESFVKKQLRTQQIAVPKRGPVITAQVVAKLTANSSPPKKNDWRRKHEEFISAIRSAKQVQVHLAKGGKLSDLPPPPPSENPDYISCPHCGRRFNESAAERHIPKCATFLHNKPKPNARGGGRK